MLFKFYLNLCSQTCNKSTFKFTAIQISHPLFYISYLLFSGKYDIWIEVCVYVFHIQNVAQHEKVCGCIVEYPMLINLFAFDVWTHK